MYEIFLTSIDDTIETVPEDASRSDAGAVIQSGTRNEIALGQSGAPAVAQEHTAKRPTRTRRVHNLPGTPGRSLSS